MMWWYGNGTNGWGLALMGVGMVLFWGLAVLAVIAVVRGLGREDRTPPRSTAEDVLAQRFARGEIDDQEYRERLSALRSVPGDHRPESGARR
jgi:putative membrane protein